MRLYGLIGYELPITPMRRHKQILFPLTKSFTASFKARWCPSIVLVDLWRGGIPLTPPPDPLPSPTGRERGGEASAASRGWGEGRCPAASTQDGETTQGEIIEEYPEDKPYPSCLIYGDTFPGEPVHSVWAYNEANRWAVLITVYRPDPKRWINWRKRRPKNAAI